MSDINEWVPFDLDFVSTLQDRVKRKLEEKEKTAVFNVLLTKEETVTEQGFELLQRRLINKVPPFQNFINEVESDFDLVALYGKEVAEYSLIVNSWKMQGNIPVVKYAKNIVYKK